MTLPEQGAADENTLSPRISFQLGSSVRALAILSIGLVAKPVSSRASTSPTP